MNQIPHPLYSFDDKVVFKYYISTTWRGVRIVSNTAINSEESNEN